MVVAAVVLFLDVMRLQPVTAWAPFDRALSLVPLEYVCSNRWWDCLGPMENRESPVAVGVDDASTSATEDLGKSVRPDAKSAARGGSGFSMSGRRHQSVYENLGYYDRPARLFAL
jgi:hypothetical protein